MEFSNTSSSKDEPSDSEIYYHTLPKEMLEAIFKHLNNVQDLAQARYVCRFWHLVATPLYLTKIDQIEICFYPTDQKEAKYHRVLSEKYREKQRRIPYQKLSQTDIDAVHSEISADISIDSEDTNCLVSKYCDYVESGGTIQYTNFNFAGISFYKNEVVSRFFSLCGKNVTQLTVSSHSDYWYCDQPVALCSKCLEPELQKTNCVLSIFQFRTLLHTYCPNLNILTLKEKDTVNGLLSSSESDKDELDEDICQDDVEEMQYMMLYGDISNPKSDEPFKLAKELPPYNNIYTVRVSDELVARCSETMFIYHVFALCHRVTSASCFGKQENAVQSRTFDFVRALLTNGDNNINELYLPNLDAVIIDTLLHRHQIRLKLKLLKVNYLVTHLAESNILQFLESQSTTLETFMCGLTQKKNPQWSNEKIRFPKVMPKLTHLRIGLGKQEPSHSSSSPPKEFASIDWATQFPSLKTLMIPEYATNVTIASFFEHPNPVEPLSTVTGLELPARLATGLMARAGFLFPNVTQLAVGYQNIDSLRQIWTMWRKLKSLHLSVVDYNERCPKKSSMEFLSLDELLTGFDKEQIEIAKDGNRYIIGKPNFPSITNLQDLHELTIYAAPYRTHSGDLQRVNHAKDNVVTDVSLSHALIKLPSLKYLDISDHLHNISPSADLEFCSYKNLFHEDNVTTRKNYTVMCNYRGREEAHPMCRQDTMYKDK